MGLMIGGAHWGFPPVTGGVEIHLLTICPEMARQGAEVTVLCGSPGGERATDRVDGVTIERRDGMVPARLEEARGGVRTSMRNRERCLKGFWTITR